MKSPSSAALQAEYVDLKFIKTRKVAQIVLEIPIEQSDAFIAAFGSPRPDKTVPVALARLNPTDAYVRQIAENQERPKGGPLAKKAGIVCGELAFTSFLVMKLGHDLSTYAAPEDANKHELRKLCGVNSRAELDHNPEAAARFRKLLDEYEMWRTHPELAG